MGTSDLVNAGTNVGFTFTGSAPDLGVLNTPATRADGEPLEWWHQLIFAARAAGPAGRGIVAATNIALPVAQWSLAATNQFDTSGNLHLTNPLPAGITQRFYRAKLP